MKCCGNCGKEIYDGEKFCGSCGTPVEEIISGTYDNVDNIQNNVCKRCGTKRENSARFCGNCGYDFESEVHSIPVPQNSDTENPSRYIPNKEFNKARNNHPALLALIISCVAVLLTAAVIIVFCVINVNNKDNEKDYLLSNTTPTPAPTVAATTIPTPISMQTPVPQTNAEPMQTPIIIPPINSAQYSASDYFYPSDTVLFSQEFLDTLTEQTARYVRNELYARHHRAFKSDDLNTYFSNKTWYYADSSLNDTQIEAQFNSIEKENKNIIINYERSKGWNNQ